MEKEKTYPELIGESKHIRELRQQIQVAANNDFTVLIQGPTGTGKELVARGIHFLGVRKEAPFLPVNCAGIPENLVESELFGHEKGSFTGALTTRIGKFEQCNGGTLFLDEIGDMSLATQAKILRVLQDRSFQRVGGNKEIKADVRLITATNKNLREEIKKGSFRDDLFSRLKNFNIYTEALANRAEDIILLVHYFLLQRGIRTKAIDWAKIFLLYIYDYPANVRDLLSLIDHDYSYIRRELLKEWAAKNKMKEKDLENLRNPSASELFKHAKCDYMEEKGYFSDYSRRPPAALFYPEIFKSDCEKMVRAYEITNLNLHTELNTEEIEERLQLRNGRATPKGFKEYFGLEMPQKETEFGASYPLKLYPTFIFLWNKIVGFKSG